MERITSTDLLSLVLNGDEFLRTKRRVVDLACEHKTIEEDLEQLREEMKLKAGDATDEDVTRIMKAIGQLLQRMREEWCNGR